MDRSSQSSKNKKKAPNLLASMFQKKIKSQEASSATNKPPTQERQHEQSSSSSLNTPTSDETEHESPSSPAQTQDEIGSGSGSIPTSSQTNESLYDVDLLPHDPGKRKNIAEYPLNEQNAVRRAYILRGPCQPKSMSFPQRKMSGSYRRFNASWYNIYRWLEYSIEKDAAFCFVCYLFKNDAATIAPEGDAFVKDGFRSWNKPRRLRTHEGEAGSAHKFALQKFEALKNLKGSIINAIEKQSVQANIEYKIRLQASLQCLRYLLRQGLAIRGHDESEESINKGNFLELLQWLANIDEKVGNFVLKNAPGNHQLTAPSIQKEIINACAKETTKVIMQELGDDYFGILADESSDVSQREQLALCLRYVDRKGKLIERFLGIVHVHDTTALSLKTSIDSLLMAHSLSPSKIRGQGYDGASNMSGEINGLKSLFMRENPCAYYIHCFAHQLQLTLVAVSRKNDDCGWFFDAIAMLLNVVGVSCKRNEMLRESQVQRVAKALDEGELVTGKGLNQEIGLSRAGDTRWGCHLKTMLHIIALYPDMIEVLVKLGRQRSDDRVKAQGVLFALESFDFVFMLHVISTIFGYAHELNLSLQRKDQDIVNAMSCVNLTKEQLQALRDNGWDALFNKVLLYCCKYNVEVPDMEVAFIPRGRSRRFVEDYTNLHHYRVEIFLKVIDLQLQELNNRFDEVSMELLNCMACLSPINSFSSFDKQKLLRLGEFYPNDFSSIELLGLDFQLDNFIVDMRNDDRFSDLRDLGHLSMKLVETGKHVVFSQVYKLLKLVLILPVATASVERVFSALNYIKNKLRNRIGDQMLNDCLVTFIERDAFLQVSDDQIMDRFQKMRPRRGQL